MNIKIISHGSLLSLVLLSGCASFKPQYMNQQQLKTLQDKKQRIHIVRTLSDSKHPGVETNYADAAGETYFGLLGAVIGSTAASANGEALEKEDHIPLISKEMQYTLTKEFKENKKYHFNVQLQDKGIESLQHTSLGAGENVLVIDVRPWQLEATHQALSFSVDAKLYTQGMNKIIWHDRCYYDSRNNKANQGTSLYQFESNNGELIKKVLKEGADYCSTKLYREFLITKN